jgi:Ca2+:H+ antiporter
MKRMVIRSNQNEISDEDVPEWGKLKCIVILVVVTVLYSLISEQVIDSMEPALQAMGLKQAFVGVLFLGVISNTSEIINGVNFGLSNKIALAVEVSSAATIQTTLIQIPILVLFSAIINHASSNHSFTLIFPKLNLFAIIFSVMIVTYIQTSGKSNYFEGSALVLVYVLFIIAFYFVP